MLDTAMAMVEITFLTVGLDARPLHGVKGAGEFQVGDVTGDEGQVAAARAEHRHIGKNLHNADGPVHRPDGDKALNERGPVDLCVEDERHCDRVCHNQHQKRQAPNAAPAVHTVDIGFFLFQNCLFHEYRSFQLSQFVSGMDTAMPHSILMGSA